MSHNNAIPTHITTSNRLLADGKAAAGVPATAEPFLHLEGPHELDIACYLGDAGHVLIARRGAGAVGGYAIASEDEWCDFLVWVFDEFPRPSMTPQLGDVEHRHALSAFFPGASSH